MPANEGTFCEDSEHQSFEDLKELAVSNNNYFTNKITTDDLKLNKNKSNDMENSNICADDFSSSSSSSTYQSAPSKISHENFLRDSFEVILQHAVFDVSLIIICIIQN